METALLAGLVVASVFIHYFLCEVHQVLFQESEAMNTEVTPEPTTAITPAVNWFRVAWYLGLTFGLTWLLDLVLYLNGGLNGGLTRPGNTLLLQFQMLLPAFSAMLLGAFFFKDSPIYYRNNHGASRWFVYFYFLLTGLNLIGCIVSLIQPDLRTTLPSAYYRSVRRRVIRPQNEFMTRAEIL
jgi:hypothetical protein